MSATGLMKPLKWFLDLFTGETDSNVSVERALTSAAFFYGVRKITNNFSMLPCHLYKRQNNITEIKDKHPAQLILKESPNAYQVPFVWKQQHLSHAILWGNGASYIYRENGVPKELIPLMPDRTMVWMVDGQKVFTTKPDRDDRFDLVTDMRNNPEQVVSLEDADVFHTMGFTVDGYSGISIVRMAANTLNIDTSADRHSMRQLKKGYAGGLMLEAPPGAFRGEAQAREFLEDFRRTHDGEDNAGKTAMLREGIKANVMAMSNKDAELLDNRLFTRQQIALWLGLESILGDEKSVSYNSLEQKNLSYLMNCLGAWLTQFEQQAAMKLLTLRERQSGYYFKVNDGALLRSDKSAAAEFVSKLISATVISRNEAREVFDLNPVEGGDVYENPATSSNASRQIEQDDPEDDSEDSTPSQPASAQNRSALEDTIRNLIKVESARVVAMAKKPSALISKVDKFYERWERDLADKFESFGLDRDLATKHCQESKHQILAIAEKNHGDEVETVLRNATALWQNRSSKIIYGGVQC